MRYLCYLVVGLFVGWMFPLAAAVLFSLLGIWYFSLVAIRAFASMVGLGGNSDDQ